MQKRAAAMDRGTAAAPVRDRASFAGPSRSHLIGNQARLRGIDGGSSARPLHIGHAHDPAEAQADLMASRLSGGVMPSGVSRQDAIRTDPHGGRPAPASVMRTMAESGRPLDPGTRAHMEEGFGRDLSTLRIHDGALASQSAGDIGARAWSANGHIAFASGTFRPGTATGNYLIAHEIAHSLMGEQGVVRRDSLMESAGKWYDEQKWAIYRGMIKGLKTAKNAAIQPLRGYVAEKGGEFAAVGGQLIDQIDFALDMLIALLLAIIGLAVGFSEGIVGLVKGVLQLAYNLLKLLVNMMKAALGHPDDYIDDCRAIVAALSNLVPALKQQVDDWLKRYEKATAEEQVLMGTELVGHIEAFIATFALAGAKAGKATTITIQPLEGFGGLQPAMAMASPATLTIPAVVPQFGAEAVVVSSQAMQMSSLDKGSGGSSGSPPPKKAPPAAQKKAAPPKQSPAPKKAPAKPKAPKVPPPPMELKFIEKLKEAFPRLKKLKIEPKARPGNSFYFEKGEGPLEVGGTERWYPNVSGAPEFAFEERMATSQGNYSLAVYDRGKVVIELDGISLDGWIEEVKINQKASSVEDIVVQIRRQADFAEAYGLKGVRYSIDPPAVELLVEERLATERLKNVISQTNHGE